VIAIALAGKQLAICGPVYYIIFSKVPNIQRTRIPSLIAIGYFRKFSQC